jgi:hypothetical protein
VIVELPDLIQVPPTSTSEEHESSNSSRQAQDRDEQSARHRSIYFDFGSMIMRRNAVVVLHTMLPQ